MELFDDSGKYNRPMTHLVRTTSKDSFGGTEFTFASDGATYWGSVEQTGSEEVEELGRVVTRTKAKIRLKGWYLSINVLDRLTDLLFQETYRIDSIARKNDDCWELEGFKL